MRLTPLLLLGVSLPLLAQGAAKSAPASKYPAAPAAAMASIKEADLKRDLYARAGDARRGQSLIVWAISEGRKAAHFIDKYLMGKTSLPSL